MQPMPFLLQTFNILVDLLTTLIFIRVVLSWLVRDKNALTEFIVRCTEPILAPVRRLLPIMGGMDFSPIAAYFILSILRQIINQAFL
jgi:YggT family protein